MGVRHSSCIFLVVTPQDDPPKYCLPCGHVAKGSRLIIAIVNFLHRPQWHPMSKLVNRVVGPGLSARRPTWNLQCSAQIRRRLP